MKTKPFLHQQKALAFHLARSASADYSEQGTGKTWVALALIEERIKRKEIERAMVVCPAAVTGVWVEETKKHSELLNPMLLKRTAPDKFRKDSKHNLYIISYDSLSEEIVKIAIEKVQQVIFDEVHKVKNIKAKRTRLALRLSEIKYRLQLSGTPFPNDLVDVWSLAYLIDRGKTFGKSYKGFLYRFFYEYNPFPSLPHVVKYIPSTFMKETLKLFIERNSVRFLRDQIKDMPEKIYQTLFVDLPPEQKKIYVKLASELPLDEFDFDLPANKLAKYEKLQQITSGFLYTPSGDTYLFRKNPKLEALKEILPNLTFNGRKTIIAVKYREEIERLVTELEEYKPLVLAGETSNKIKVVKEFQEDNLHKVLIMQIQCGIGVTLTRADSMVFLSNNFNYADRYQCEDRICRQGQSSKSVLYIDIVAKGTIDQKILSLLKTKKQQLEAYLEKAKTALRV